MARARYGNTARDKNPQADGPKREYTKEQMDAVRRINECIDHYDILGVDRDSSHKNVKKAYEKLILLVHPDKNPAPGAGAAFIAVRRAYIIISVDWAKCSSNYSEKGNTQRDSTPEPKANTQRERSSTPRANTQRERPSPPRANTQRDYPFSPKANNTHHNWYSAYKDYEPYNFYFPRNPKTQHGFNYYNPKTERSSNYFATLSCLVILISVFVALFMRYIQNVNRPVPVYVLDSDPDYPVLRTTLNFDIAYYVRDNFETEYRGSLPELEATIEETYFARLIKSCEAERAVKADGNKGSWSVFSSATPSCDKLLQQDSTTFVKLKQMVTTFIHFIWRIIEEFMRKYRKN